MKSVVFLCSGGGGNLRFVQAAMQRGWLPGGRIVGVLTDRECGASEFARGNGLFTRCMDFSRSGQADVQLELRRLAPDAVVTNVHKILTPDFVAEYEHALLNLHYSLLPAFGGTIGVEPVRRALEYGVTLLGVTAHRVSAEVDAGRPLAQAAIPVEAGDDVDHVMDLVFRAGCLALLEALRSQLGIAGQPRARLLRLCGRDVMFNPFGSSGDAWADETFWQELKANTAAEPPSC
ncbi:phosphoribosylglycinamide formyltransferase [Achromobacter insolitus]|uniref:phosphoribosylglycinamide formyltransferase n=1 Tax=Achromobacter insolitus TaxID=217204 RepID=UPI000DD13000|nr:formyltransferase family protein [Achromobacter insolitus]AXA73624.1 phosphoribosylglycinamide formyltransferase [Achromobacter insolitus]